MRFTPKTLSIAGGLFALAVITSVTTIIVAGGGRGAGHGESLYPEAAGSGVNGGGLPQGAAGETGGRERFSVDALLTPSEGEALMQWEWRYYREPKSRWDDEDVSRFWIDPDEVSIDYLVERNDDLIEEMFESVP